MTKPPRPMQAVIQNWTVRKPAARSRYGIVAAQHEGAARIGAEALAAGGSAVDAALATAFALAAVEPWNSGLGGIGFMVVQPAGAVRAEVVDFGPVAPRGLDPADYPLTGETATELFTWARVRDDRNMHGPLSFAVPGAVRGYGLAHRRFGRLPWRELVMPAVRLAEAGLPVDWWVTVKTASAAADLRRYEESRRIWLPDGLPPHCPANGEPPRLRLGPLAETLERLATCGAEDFYTGEIAQAIAADARAGGGSLSAADLAQCQARIVPALDIPYRGVTMQAARGLTAAPTLADVLGRLAGQRFGPAPDAAYFEAVIAALQQAYAARLSGLGDTGLGDTGLGDTGLGDTGLGDTGRDGETCTTHITAVDRDGGIAALTTTLLSSFGSRYVLPRTGILMNNGVMWFDPQPGRPNSLGPGKRALTNMCPVIVARDGRGWFGAGASGGRRIMGSVLQLASFVIDFGMSAEEAGHHPRVDVSGEHGAAIDCRMPREILDRLTARCGADIVEHAAWPNRFSCPNLVLRDTDGTHHGISDVMSPWSAAIAEPGR